jgi:hypothetical protein
VLGTGYERQGHLMVQAVNDRDLIDGGDGAFVHNAQVRASAAGGGEAARERGVPQPNAELVARHYSVAGAELIAELELE